MHGLDVLDPPALESELNHIAGVVANGLFARRATDVVLIGAAVQEHGLMIHTPAWSPDAAAAR